MAGNETILNAQALADPEAASGAWPSLTSTRQPRARSSQPGPHVGDVAAHDVLVVVTILYDDIVRLSTTLIAAKKRALGSRSSRPLEDNSEGIEPASNHQWTSHSQ